MVGNQVGVCDDCESTERGSFPNQIQPNSVLRTEQVLGNGDVLHQTIIPLECGSDKACTRSEVIGDIRFLRRYKAGSGLTTDPGVRVDKKIPIPWIDIAISIIDSSLSRYYIDQEITEDISQLVNLTRVFKDSSGNYLSVDKITLYPLVIQRRSRVIKTEYMGVIRSVNQKTRSMDLNQYLEEKGQ